MAKPRDVKAELVDARGELERGRITKGNDTASKEIVHSFVFRRAMKFYPITDAEFETLAFINTLFNVLLAVGPLLAGIGATALLSLLTIKLDEQPVAFGAYGATGILSVGGACMTLWFAWRTYKQRKDVLARWQRLEAIPESSPARG